MFLNSSFNFINEFYFFFKNQIRKIYLSSSLYDKKISKVSENVLVYQPSLNILSSLIKYEKQKKKIEDFNVQSIWENKQINYNDCTNNFGKKSCLIPNPQNNIKNIIPNTSILISGISNDKDINKIYLEDFNYYKDFIF